MRILNQVNYIGGVGADWWIGSGFRDAFEDAGHEFFWYTAADDLSELTPAKLPVFLKARAQGVKIVMRVDAFFDREPFMRAALIEQDPAHVYFGEVEGSNMDKFQALTGKPYVIIANAAHHRHHFPTAPVVKYDCDIVFMGAWLPDKREAFAKLLAPLTSKYRVKIYGPNWTIQDKALRSLGYLARRAGWPGLSQKLQRFRISVPVTEENQLYSSAKVCLNLHERGATLNELPHLILNERTFRIPACGGFELCDFVPPLRRYFTEDEMVMADDRRGDWVKDWFEKIEYYLHHDAERKRIQAAGTARALRDHTYKNRVAQLLDLLNLGA